MSRKLLSFWVVSIPSNVVEIVMEVSIVFDDSGFNVDSGFITKCNDESIVVWKSVGNKDDIAIGVCDGLFIVFGTCEVLNVGDDTVVDADVIAVCINGNTVGSVVGVQ